MRIRIHSNALKHGLTHEQIMRAYETGNHARFGRKRDEKSDPPRWAMIGYDNQARAIEIVFVVENHHSVLIFHANYLTKGFRKELSQ